MFTLKLCSASEASLEQLLVNNKWRYTLYLLRYHF